MTTGHQDPIGEAPREHSEHVSAVQTFGCHMIAKLDANAHKGHWSTVTVDYLLNRLRQEVEELADALDRGLPNHIVSEAADVANFAMMIADRYSTRTTDLRLAEMTADRDRWAERVKTLEARMDKAREALEGR